MAAKRRRLLWQIYMTLLGLSLFALALCYVLVTASVESFHFEHTERQLRDSALYLREVLVDSLDSPSEFQAKCEKLASANEIRITIIDLDGVVLADTAKNPKYLDNHGSRPEIKQALQGEIGMSRRESSTLRHELLYVAIPLKKPSDKTPKAVLRTAFVVPRIEQNLAVLQTQFLIGMLGILVLAAISGFYLSRRIIHPLEEIITGVERFSRGELDYRLPISQIKEPAFLAIAMNRMAHQLSDRIATLFRQRNENAALLSSMSEGVIAVDSEECLITINRSAAELFGLDPIKCKGKPLIESVRHKALQQLVSKVLKTPHISEENGFEELILRQNGTELFVQAQATPLKNLDGAELGVLVVFNDVSHVKNLERVRQDFVANVSHELRTPITSIKGFVETLLDGALDEPEAARRFLNIIQTKTEYLQSIIEDLLVLSRVEEGNKGDQIKLERLPLKDVLLASIESLSQQIKAKNILLNLQCEDSLEANLNARLFEQAVTNLLANAIRHSDNKGEIEIIAESSEQEVKLHIKDQGEGMEKAHLERLFERFYRVDFDRGRKQGGTGLGLSIVKHIARAHNGSVTVESEIGVGSDFCIIMPS